ncbi:MAG: SIS domain-containing protein [Actinomycetota bacterium]
MCGIVAVVRRPNSSNPPSSLIVMERMQAALACLEDESLGLTASLGGAEALLAEVDGALRGTPGIIALLADTRLGPALEEVAHRIEQQLQEIDDGLNASLDAPLASVMEELSAALISARDRVWAVRSDRLATAWQVGKLAGAGAGPAQIEAWASIRSALGAIDRLEVRGRDSAGLHVLVWNHSLDIESARVNAEIIRRSDPTFAAGAVRVDSGNLGFVYKAAAEIGELGDNVAALRRLITHDALLHEAIASEGARVSVVGHTRWASVGTISEPNAHPLDASEEPVGDSTSHLVAVLNGDIDNHPALVAAHHLQICDSITTDAKLIPVLISRRMAEGEELPDAFAGAVAQMDGSMAIVANAASQPNVLAMAVRGSGQGLYVGLAQDCYIVASEPYGVIEEAQEFLRLDGDGSSGCLVLLDGDQAGTLEGIDRRSYQGRPLEVTQAELRQPEITTRDIDRRGFPHFLLKEITEAPASFRKTLRGRIVNEGGRLQVALDDTALPEELLKRLFVGSIKKVAVIGQGTAAVAGQAVAAAIEDALAPLGVAVSAMPAAELSGFSLQDDMSDTLIVAISQSGTTTDTNRTVDMAASRGALVVGIINRRNTDLGDKAHGVVYTSDGRDLEMSVASTKAFYAQVAAGFLLSLALAEGAGCADQHRSSELLEALQELPEAMEQVLGQREAIGAITRRYAARRRHWAVVGSGPNRVAAAEVRIKLSELCYKSVACDSTEDKKHIDLSAEPLILVCAAGLSGSNAEDVRKEIAIYRAHKAAPVVIATQGTAEFDGDVIPVPYAHPRLAFVLSAMAGHLFGYEAALAIDEQARPLRLIRAAIQELAGEGLSAGAILGHLGPLIEPASRQFLDCATHGGCDGVMNLGPAMRLALLLRCATGELPFEAYELEHGAGAGPKAFLDDLVATLTSAIDDLTRSVDAVKHQAKTVTVGISRSEALFAVPLVKEVMAVGPRIEQLGYRALRSLAALDPAVAEVTGFTRYVVAGDVRSSGATIHVIDRGGIAKDLLSRTDLDPRLRGTKRAALEKAEVEVTIGRSDGRPVILIPERKGDIAQGLTLLHVAFRDFLPAQTAREVLLGYRPARFEALVAAVTETEEKFFEEPLGQLTMAQLLVEPVLTLAERWRNRG